MIWTVVVAVAAFASGVILSDFIKSLVNKITKGKKSKPSTPDE